MLRSASAGALVLASSLAVGIATLFLHGADGRAWFAATENVSRFSAMVFLVLFAGEPIAYFLPSTTPLSRERNRKAIDAAFLCAYATYLAFLVARLTFAPSASAIETAILCTAASVAPVALAWSSAGGKTAQRGIARSAVRTAAIVWFWLVFVAGDIDHLYGPHRPDRYFGISLLLLTGALLLRFAAALVRKLRAGRNPKPLEPTGAAAF